MSCRTSPFASNLRSQNTGTIGMMVSKLKSDFINSVLAGVEKVATETETGDIKNTNKIIIRSHLIVRRSCLKESNK